MRTPKNIAYGYVRPAGMTFDQTVQKVEEGLKAEGFGVLCLIDIQAKLKASLGIDFPRYIILGACNPPLAREALHQEIDLGLLLPCNAVVYESEGQVFVGVVDAAKMLSVVGNPNMEPLAQNVNERLRRVVDRLTAPAAN